MQELRFLGAAGTVTGSKFLLTTPGGKVLVDCGMYQGDRQLRQRNWSAFPVPSHEIDAVVISHAHLDHCGWLPRLVRRGYSGPIYCSPCTALVAAIVLRDAAHLQEEDADFASARGYSKHHPPLPLFDTADAEKTISLFRDLEHGAAAQLTRDMSVRAHRAGHILGSSTLEFTVGDRVVVFSGDLGSDSHPLLNPPDPLPEADYVVVESTTATRFTGRATPTPSPSRSGVRSCAAAACSSRPSRSIAHRCC